MILHVRGPDVNVSLNEIHQALFAKYSAKLKGEFGHGTKSEAKLLQDFLTAWKSFKMTGKTDLSMFDQITMSQIESLFSDIAKKASMFKTSSGTRFEQQFGNFIYHVLDKVGTIQNRSNLTRKNIQTGAIGAVSALDGLLDELVAQYMKDIADVTKTEAERLAARTELAQLKKYIKAGAKPGKTDITATSVEVIINNAELSPDLYKIIDLLHRSQFTLKNYSSSYNAYLLNIQRDLDPTSVHFGNTTLYRTFLAVLGELGYNTEEIKSLFYAMNNTSDLSAAAHFYHIRFVYELTGMGQKYLQKDFSNISEADFLVYNDPDSINIYVRSTADLIIEMFNTVFEGDWRRGISISKYALSQGQQTY